MKMRTLAQVWMFGSMLLGLGAAPTMAGTDSADPTNPPQGVVADEWYVLMFSGKQAGYTHTVIKREGDRIHTSESMMLSLNRASQTMQISAETNGVESLDGKPLSFESSTKLGAMETLSRGNIRNGKVFVESTQFGQTTKSEFDLPATALMGWGVYLETLKRGFEPGTTYELEVYAPGQNPAAALPVRVEIVGPDTIELFGETFQAIKSTQTMNLNGFEFVMTSWSDDRGNLLRSDQSMMGMNIQMLRADKERALSGGGVSPEMMISSLVKPDKPIDRFGAREIRYRLSLTDGAAKMSLPPVTGMQQAEQRSDGSVELLVRRQDHAALAEASGPVGKAATDLDEYLASVPMINWRDPEIAAMAERARGGETNAYRLAVRLREYVSEIIDEKSLDVGFATASEVARNRKGDCSEHGVLLAALGRACGIPSRVVGGLVYVDRFAGQRGVFGFHMWTQFHIDGGWVDLDAAQNETDCNPTHIALTLSSMNEEAAFSIAAALLETIGRLKIEVLDVATK